MTQAMNPPVVPVEPANTITRDAPCYGCGYNLRSLAYDADCPECGKPIADWVREDRIGAVDPAWLARAQRGARLLQVGVIAALPLVYPGLVIAFVGLWMLSAKPASGLERKADRAARLGARWSFGLGLLILTVCVIGLFWNFGGQYRRLFGDWWVYDAALIAAGALSVLGLASAWLYLSELARRLPDGALSRRCAALRRDWFVVAGAVVVIAVVANALRWGGVDFWTLQLLHEHAVSIVLATPITLALLWLWWRTLGMTRVLRVTLRGLEP